MIQMMIATMMITAITPTAAPALKMPAIAEQLLKPARSRNKAKGSNFFFIVVWF